MADSAKESNRDDNERNGSLHREILEAFHAFSNVPENLRLSYLLHLSGMRPDIIATVMGTREGEIRRQLENIENILHGHIESLAEDALSRMAQSDIPDEIDEPILTAVFRLLNRISIGSLLAWQTLLKTGSLEVTAKELRLEISETARFIDMAKENFHQHIDSLMPRLLEIDANSPPPLNSLHGLVDQVKSLRELVADGDELLETEAKNVGSPHMTPSEKQQADDILFAVVSPYREMFVLHHLTDLDVEEITVLLGLSVAEFDQVLRFIQDIFYQLIEGLLICFVLRKEGLPDPPQMTAAERNTARLTWADLPFECRQIVKFHIVEKIPCEEIAKKLDLDTSYVSEMIRYTKRQIMLRGESLVISWLRESFSDHTTPEAILDALQNGSLLRPEDLLTDPESEYPVTEAERAEAKRTLEQMDPMMLNVVRLHAAGLNSNEIAEMLEIDGETVKEIRQNGFGILANRTERLVTALLQRRMELPHAPQLKRNEKRAAKQALRRMSLKCRLAFALYMATGSSLKEAAETLNLTAEDVSASVKRAKKRIRHRAIYVAMEFIRDGYSPQEARERIVASIRQTRDFFSPESFPHETHPDATEKLLPAQCHEMEIAWASLSPSDREVYALCRGLNLEEYVVGRYLGVEHSIVRESLSSVRNALSRYLRLLIVGMLKKRENIPGTMRMTEMALETARIAYRQIPENTYRFFERKELNGESVEMIAEWFEVDPITVEKHLECVTRYLNVHAETLAMDWLRGKPVELGGRMRAEHIALKIRERSETEPTTCQTIKSTKNVYREEEVIEIEKMIQKMDDKIREAFVLHYGAEMLPSEIAIIQQVDENVVINRLSEAISEIRCGMDYLIVGMLHRHFRVPDTRRMTLAEIITAKAAFRCIPIKSRKPYILFKAEHHWKNKIASLLGMTGEELELRLDESDFAIQQRYLKLAATIAQKLHHDQPIIQSHIRADAKKYRSQPLSHGHNSDPVARLPKKKRRSPVMASFSGLGPVISHAGESLMSTVKTVLASIGATGFMALAAPFLWIMSVLISGQISGFAFIRTAPTLEARRWLTERLFYIYSMIFVGPLGLVILAIKLGIENRLQLQILVSLYLVSFGCFAFISLYATAKKYNKLCIHQNLDITKKSSYSKLYFIINFGFILHTTVYSQLVWAIAKENLPLLYEQCAIRRIILFLLLTVSIGVVHATAYLMFSYFLRISKNERTFQETPPIFVSEKAGNAGRRILEFLRVLPFALFPISAGIGHFLFKNTHTLCNIIEMIGFTILWALAWYLNITTNKRRKLRVLIYFIIQILVMAYIRLNYYNTF